MDWIKRNLYFVIGAVVALALLGGAGWYLYSKLTLNDQKSEALNKAYEDLKRFNQQSPHPGNGPVDNIKAAKEQTVELRAFQDKVRTVFEKIPPIPDLPKITDRDFSFAPQISALPCRRNTNSLFWRKARKRASRLAVSNRYPCNWAR